MHSCFCTSPDSQALLMVAPAQLALAGCWSREHHQGPATLGLAPRPRPRGWWRLVATPTAALMPQARWREC